MKFGLGYVTTQIPPDNTRTEYGKYKEAGGMAKLADDIGFDSVWISEHHGEDDRYLSSMFPMATAMAQSTSDITIGTAILLAPSYDPLQVAEDAAAVDIFSDGRFELGVGIGYRGREFKYFDVPDEAWNAIKDGSYYLNNRYVEEFDRCSDDIDFPPPEENARDWTLTGDRDELTEQILEFSHLLAEDDHFVVRLKYLRMEHDVAMEAIERFEKEVIPRGNTTLSG